LKRLLWILAVLTLVGCDKTPTGLENELTAEERYALAINDAMIAEADEIVYDLCAIRTDNAELSWQEDSLVMMMTWTPYPDSYRNKDTLRTWWGQTWVTPVPEMLNFMEGRNIASADLRQRVAGVLGMPPDANGSACVELWVRPQDLFRPSPDPEIDDSQASLTFSDAADTDYINWFYENIISSYYTVGYTHYPWTRLGYTYDYLNPDSERGLSEFVIQQNSKVWVEAVYTTEEYYLKSKE
jgi:hypothetical protein